MRSSQALLPLLFTVAATAATPVWDVFNAASMIPASIQTVAQGSRFVFQFHGTGIGPARRVAADFPLPTTAGLAGITLQANVGSAQAYPCILIAVSFEQVVAVLPSNVPVGDGQLTLYYTTANGTVMGGPNPPIRVVPANFGIYSLNGLGGGPALAVDASGNEIDITNPVHNGDTISIRGTGLGKIDADETMPPPKTDLNSGVQLFVGGQPATVLYGGRAGGGAGNDRIDFVVPDGVSGCYVSLYAKMGGIVSNFTTIPVTSPDQTACADPMLRFSGADLQPTADGNLNVGVLSLISLGSEQANANFNRYDPDSLVGSPSPNVAPSIGSCITYVVHGDSPTLPAFVQPLGLDAGQQVTVANSSGSARTLALNSKGSYSAQQGGGGGGNRQPFLLPGVYTFNGNGGADVGPFSASITIPTGVTWTNQPPLAANVPRSQDLQLTWSGGGPDDVVAIFGFSISPAVPSGLVGEFLCTAPASAGQFTVPADVLANIPSVPLSFTSPGSALSLGTFSSARFKAPGLNFGYVWSLVSAAQIVAFQ